MGIIPPAQRATVPSVRTPSVLKPAYAFPTFQPSAELRGKTVAIIALGCDASKASLYADIVSWGVNLVIVESEGNIVLESLRDRGAAFELCPLELTMRPTLVRDVSDALFGKISNGIEIDAVLTFWDDAVSLAARVAGELGVGRYSCHSAVDSAHDKSASRELLHKLGYNVPRNRELRSREDAERLVTDMGSQTGDGVPRFPVIMKPRFGAASIGVMKVNTRDGILTAYDAIVEILNQEYATQGLMGLLFEGDETLDLMTVLVEEFLAGPEYDVDVVIQGGIVLYSEPVDNLPLQMPHFCELMEIVPPYDTKRALAVSDYAKGVAKNFGFNDAVLHIEIIDDETRGLCLVELNPRMGGGPMRDIHKACTGVDLAERQLLCSLGIPIIETHNERRDGFVVALDLHPQFSGVLDCDIDTMEFKDPRTLSSLPIALQDLTEEEMSSRVSIFERVTNMKSGSSVIGLRDLGNMPTAIGRIIIYVECKNHRTAASLGAAYFDSFVMALTEVTRFEGQEILWEPETTCYSAWKDKYKEPLSE